MESTRVGSLIRGTITGNIFVVLRTWRDKHETADRLVCDAYCPKTRTTMLIALRDDLVRVIVE